MGRKVQYHVRKDTDETELNWAKKGFVVKDGAKSETKWTNSYCQQTAEFYGEDDVVRSIRKANAVVKKYREEQKERHRQYHEWQRKQREEEERRQAEYRNGNKAEWKQLIQDMKRIVVFDTETTGLDASTDYILSLSWQVLDGELSTIEEETRYFDNPLPEDVCWEALEVNGLTNERLAELGTSDKRTALQDFVNEVRESDLIIAHNASFDRSFMWYECKREGVNIKTDRAIPYFDTMTSMTRFCGLRRGNRELKWPRLGELAYILKIDTSDIDYHHSSSDVEVTVRCFRKIVGEGLISPTITK